MIKSMDRPNLSSFTPPPFPAPREPIRKIDQSQWRQACMQGRAQLLGGKHYITEASGEATSRLVRVQIDQTLER